MAEIASAFVSLAPSAKGFQGATEREIGPALEKSGRSGGGRLGHALVSGAKGILAVGGVALGAALFKGFQRLKAIDQAKAKLSGLGNSAKTVDKIMSNALASVKGTAFGLDEASTVAASATAAGIKPGRELTKTLKLVADAATIGGTSLGEMGAIFNKVAASNKIQGDVINQLNDKGIPIVQLLGKQLGKTSSEVTDLAAKGKIDFKTFQAAMQNGLGGAALKSGTTFSGALANVGASLGRIGAGLLGGVFPHLAPAFIGITKALSPLEGKSKGIGNAIGKILGPALEGIGPFLTKIVTGLTSLDFSNLSAGEGTLGKIGDSFKKVGTAIGGIDFGALGSGLGKGAADTVTVFSVAIGFAADHVDTLAKVLPALVVAFAAYKVAQSASNVLEIASLPVRAALVVSNFALASSNRQLAAQMAVTNSVEQVGLLTRIRATVATIATAVAQRAAAVASKVWAAGQFLLNAALAANPIGIVVAAIVLLVGGLILAYKKSETFRTVVDGAFKAVGAAAKFLWENVIRPYFKFIINLWLAVAGAIVHGAAKAFGWVPGIGPKLKGAAKAFDHFRDSVNRSLNGIKDPKPVKLRLDASAAKSAAASFIAGLPQNATIDLLVRARVAASSAAKVGANAAGTDFWRGGPTWVGELGPEIVNLPRGARVTPNNQISAGGAGGVMILRVGDREFRAYAEEIADSRVGAHARMGNIASRAARR